MEIAKEININNNLNNKIDLSKNQNNFLNSMLGKTINTGLDIGIRALLPDFVEDQIINIKDNLLKFGLKKGISKTIEGAINLGKSALGIITGNFQNVNQMQMAIKKGGLIDTFSDLFDNVLEKIEVNGAIRPDVTKIIKQGKNTILNSIESNIEKNFENQLNKESNLDKFISNWKSAYENKEFKNMEIQYKKIKKELKDLAPVEKFIKEARIIENIHSLIKTNGQNFNLSDDEKELVNKLF